MFEKEVCPKCWRLWDLKFDENNVKCPCGWSGYRDDLIPRSRFCDYDGKIIVLSKEESDEILAKSEAYRNEKKKTAS